MSKNIKCSMKVRRLSDEEVMLLGFDTKKSGSIVRVA